MDGKTLRVRPTILALLAALTLLPTIVMAQADDAFVVKDMRVEGLQRISEGTVFNYLPINIGDTIDSVRVGEAVRALYGQNLFDDIEMRRDGSMLIVVVRERPSIESFEIDGNKDIKTEDLMDSLRSVGLARGRTFDRSVLDNVEMFLREQYYDRGKYGVDVSSNVWDGPNNTVRVSILVKEGDRAKIRQVNIVGDLSFDEDEIRESFTLDTANWLSWIRQDDRYAKEALEGDLEILRSFYMDRGYADFRIESTQVAISPNKKDIFVTINVDEGDVYTISDVKIVGDMVVPEVLLRSLIFAQPGSVFNQNLLTMSSEAMQFQLGVGQRLDPEAVAFGEQRGDRLGVDHRHLEVGEVGILVVADDQRVEAAEIDRLGDRRGTADEDLLFGPVAVGAFDHQEQPAAADRHVQADAERAVARDRHGRAVDRQGHVAGRHGAAGEIDGLLVGIDARGGIDDREARLCQAQRRRAGLASAGGTMARPHVARENEHQRRGQCRPLHRSTPFSRKR